MSEIKLYTNPQSRGRIVHWMLEELGEPYEVEWVAYGEQMKAEDFLAVNPMGKVPVITHLDNVVTECAAICTYLAAAFPHKGLIPSPSSSALADFYRWMFFAAGPLEMATTAKSLDWKVNPEQERMAGFGNFQHTMDALESALGKGPYICGDHFTAVDVYLGSSLMWGMMFGTIEKREIFSRYVEILSGRAALQKSNEINENQIV